MTLQGGRISILDAFEKKRCFWTIKKEKKNSDSQCSLNSRYYPRSHASELDWLDLGRANSDPIVSRDWDARTWFALVGSNGSDLRATKDPCSGTIFAVKTEENELGYSGSFLSRNID